MKGTNGQVGTEYLFVLAGIVVVSIIVTVVTLNLINSETTGPGNDWNKFESKYAKLNIISVDRDGTEYTVKNKPFGGYSFVKAGADNKFKVKFEIAERIEDYNVFFKQDNKEICMRLNQGSKGKGTVTSNVINISDSSACPNIGYLVLGKPLDIVVTVRYSQIRSETDIEKNFMKFT